MELYDFDQQLQREGTSSVKYDLRQMFFGKPDVQPLWVADMDFETPDFVRKAVINRAMHPVYGYTFRDEAYYNSIIQWFARRHVYQIQRDWILFSPGVVPALNLAVMALTEPSDSIIVQSPVYFPFFGAVTHHKRRLIHNLLIKSAKQYEIDFDQLRAQAKEAKMLILCNPHNPVGRAWTTYELEQLAKICLENNLIVLSDEIHNDLVLPGFRHQVFAALGKEVEDITITAHAASKTFNLAGLATSSVIIPNESLRRKYKHALDGLHIDLGNLFGAEATMAAFQHGDEWLGQLMGYLNRNIDFLDEYLLNNIPEISLFRPEATYLAWLDCSALGLSDEDLKSKMIHEAGLGLSAGIEFGPGGEGCMRINVACPLSQLKLALEKMKLVFGK
jgi:cystathionine beta-lyase